MKCYYCHKDLGFFSEHKCNNCGKPMCKKCRVKVNYDDYACKLLMKMEPSFSYPEPIQFSYFSIHLFYELCKEFAGVYERKVANMRHAINADNDDIELVSNNYNGERYRSLTKVQKISSSFYRDRYDAEEEIKTMAKYLGCTHIVNLRWRSDTGEEEGPKGGPHIYTVWQAIGYAAK